jgi:hypothetical protein
MNQIGKTLAFSTPLCYTSFVAGLEAPLFQSSDILTAVFSPSNLLNTI